MSLPSLCNVGRSCYIRSATAHILTAVLISFIILGGAIHYLHFRMRDRVVIPRSPGTIASAAAFTARSNMSDVLDGHLDEAALRRALQHKRFGIDKRTCRIVMEGDRGLDAGEETLLNPWKV